MAVSVLSFLRDYNDQLRGKRDPSFCRNEPFPITVILLSVVMMQSDVPGHRRRNQRALRVCAPQDFGINKEVPFLF